MPFPHFLLYCSRYFDANTVVYVDAVAFNYTKLNDEIKFLEETGVFGKLEDTCRPLTAYVACQYVYPRCNDTAQALVPVCEDSCLNFAQQCPLQFQRLTVLSASVELTSKLLNVNCTDQFSAFGSVNVDANPESCYNYYSKPLYLCILGMKYVSLYTFAIICMEFYIWELHGVCGGSARTPYVITFFEFYLLHFLYLDSQRNDQQKFQL